MKNLIPDILPNHFAAMRKSTGAAFEVLSPERFATARGEILQWEGYLPTPLHFLHSLAEKTGVGEVFYKDEGPRFGLGSFKALGGAYAAMRVLQREIAKTLGKQVSLSDIRNGIFAKQCAEITLVSATDGNHGRSLAWGCKRFGAPCRIYIHAEVSEGRAEAMQKLGAQVIRIDGDYDDSVIKAKEEAQQNGWHVVSDTSWPGYSEPPKDVMSGYGVMVQEICETLDRSPTHVFLQGGVGGLAAGVAAALRQYWKESSPRVIVVEPELAACLFESAKSGMATNVTIDEETLMAGLSCGEPSPLAWKILADEASDYLTISDSLIPPTVRLLANPFENDPTIEAGESGVAGLAALLAARTSDQLWSALDLNHNSRVLIIGSEGVTDPEVFDKIMTGQI